MADCPHLERTSAYFDGALPDDQHADAVAHLADCDACQALLRDAATFDAVLSQASPAEARDATASSAHDATAPRDANASSAHDAPASRDASPAPRDADISPARNIPSLDAHRRRRTLALGALVLAAAAALVLWLARPPAGQPQLAISLPPARALEARFTGDRFAAHRPYEPLRGDHAREPISLATLAELERLGATSDLIAGLAATGDLARANDLAAHLPATATAETDRAALALAAGDPIAALDHAYRAVDADPSLTAAWWNLALAARNQGLPRTSRASFERVIARAEPGWADEARRALATLDALASPDAATLRARANAHRATQPALARAELAEAAALAP